MTRFTDRRFAILTTIALALAASATSLANGFAYDDNTLIADSDRFHSVHRWWMRFAETYWPPIFGRSLYRPLTTLGFSIQWVAGAGHPSLFHVTNVLLYIACCVAVLLLARQVLDPAAAWCAAAIFAVHPVHVEAVGNVVGQSELMATLVVAAASAWYIRRRRAGWLQPRDVLLLVLAYAVGCLAKEGAIVLPALLLCAELTVLRDTASRDPERSLTRRIVRLAPAFVALFGVTAAEFAVRRIVIGSWLGDYPVASLKVLPLGARLLTMTAASREWLRLFVWPARLSMVYSPPYLPIITHFEWRVLPGLFAILATVVILVLAWRRAPVVAFALLWIGVALLPVSNVLFVSGVFIAERTMFLASVGLAIAAGAFGRALWSRTANSAQRELLGTVFGIVLLVATARSAVRQRVWMDNAHVVTAAVRTVPDAYAADALYGEYLGSHGAAGTAEKWMLRAMSLYPDDPELYVDLGDLYTRGDQWPAARSVFTRAIAMDATLPSARAGLILVLVHDGDYAAARTHAKIGIANGVAVDDFRRLLSTIDAAQQRQERPTP